MAIEKSPQELLALSFSIAGAVLVIIGLISLAFVGATEISEEEIAVAKTLPSFAVSVFLVAVGVIFGGVAYFIHSRSRKRR